MSVTARVSILFEGHCCPVKPNGGAGFGAGFADVTYQLPAQYLMAAAATLTALSLVAAAFSRGLRLALAAA